MQVRIISTHCRLFQWQGVSQGVSMSVRVRVSKFVNVYMSAYVSSCVIVGTSTCVDNTTLSVNSPYWLYRPLYCSFYLPTIYRPLASSWGQFLSTYVGIVHWMYRQYNCSTVYVTYSLTYGKIDSNLAKIALNWSSSPDVFTDNIPTFSEYNNNITAFLYLPTTYRGPQVQIPP